MKKSIVRLIDREIKSIWENEIAFDYKDGWLLKEDCLKNALYFHLRTKLERVLERNGLRIYTEFTDSVFEKSGYKPDMVIAEVDLGRDEKNLGGMVKKCVAVIEIKYKQGYAPSRDIIADYEKLHRYAEDLKTECKLYMATIWEYEDDPVTWERKNAAWAKGVLTELNASYKRGTGDMNFYICEHK